MKSRHPKNSRKKAPCGTSAGYAAHLRRNERPCSLCLVGSETYDDDEIQELLYEFQDWARDQQLWKTYRLSLTRFGEIFAEQGNCCACCKRTDPGEASWHIDHDHQTGLIRGILCSNCNTGIGQLGDNLAGLQLAMTYLQEHTARGGHKSAERPSREKNPRPTVSAVMERCFELFKRNVPCDQVVIIMRLVPRTVTSIHALWKKTDGEVRRVNRHFFQISKDGSQQFTCACGYAAAWGEPSEMSAAIDRVNVHIKEANNDYEAEWDQLARDEKERRRKIEQERMEVERKQKEERRLKFAEELRRAAVIKNQQRDREHG